MLDPSSGNIFVTILLAAAFTVKALVGDPLHFLMLVI